MLITTALIGSSTEPNARNISTSVAATRMPIISGTLSTTDFALSTTEAEKPPTSTWVCRRGGQRAQVAHRVLRSVAERVAGQRGVSAP